MLSPIQTDDENSTRLSNALLDHDGLMTPVLIANFGRLELQQIETFNRDGYLIRRSSIHQAANHIKILDGLLSVSIKSLPAIFFQKLQQKDVLFGQLLQDFAIPVRISERTLYQTPATAQEGTRWGRRLKMYHRDTGEFICSVEELLVPELLLCSL